MSLDEELLLAQSQGYNLNTPECIYLRAIYQTLTGLFNRLNGLEGKAIALQGTLNTLEAKVSSSQSVGVVGGQPKTEPSLPRINVQRDQHGTEWKQCPDKDCAAWTPMVGRFCQSCGDKFPVRFEPVRDAQTQTKAAVIDPKVFFRP